MVGKLGSVLARNDVGLSELNVCDKVDVSQ